MRLAVAFCLFLGLFSLIEASAQPRRTLIDAGAAGRVLVVPQAMDGEVLRLSRRGRTPWQARAQRFETFRDGAPVPIGENETALGVTGWTGGAYCCWTLHLFRQGAQGLAHVASLPFGKREPEEVRLSPPGGPAILLSDAVFDFWEAPVSLAADLSPTVPFRWTGRALEPDTAAMRRPVTAALGTACTDMAAPEDQPPPEQRFATYPDSAAAITALRAADWAARPGGRARHPGVEAARIAVCLIYAGHADEARRLLRAVWPEGAAGLPETERQIAGRLACSPFRDAVRAVNATGAPFLGARCRRNGPDQTAVFALGWR
ncbi:hypothetical protein GXW74_01105 [Roseomonas eburnea]|uniref:Uncharacterized protein n=1 Tax=Neoroseomonas eburnea TaxID=1346889 RepID=A0A9X9X5T5_9PROT|nr:hypothetical protein [Neoroseomonas eburnea]MBR0679071.1 hypothetical protein [Neoroseomonas eburnea]